MIEDSAYTSLIIQFITGIIDVYGLTIEVPPNKQIFKELLKLELAVQSIEFVYYYWMVQNIKSFENITPTRYFDWAVTTPTMLVTLMAYLDSDNTSSVTDFVISNQEIIFEIIVLNFIMLIFGLIGEFKQLDTKTSVALGFVPFTLYFKMIWNKYISNKTTSDQLFMFWFFLLTWSLYGVAALLPYEEKNTMYNILDLFAKNFLGILLVYIIWSNRVNK